MIDVHHHITSPGRHSAASMGLWSPTRAVEEMDRNGIEVGIGYPGPILESEAERNRALARGFNEYGTQLGVDHPGRFGLFAALPMRDIDASLMEIAYAIDVLHADGFGISTSYGDAW